MAGLCAVAGDEVAELAEGVRLDDVALVTGEIPLHLALAPRKTLKWLNQKSSITCCNWRSL